MPFLASKQTYFEGGSVYCSHSGYQTAYIVPDPCGSRQSSKPAEILSNKPNLHPNIVPDFWTGQQHLVHTWSIHHLR